MNLKSELLRGIYAYGLERPSPIQQRAIMPVLRNRNVIVEAHSGAYKTTAFSIPVLQILDTSNKQCQVLILVHSSELAQQIQHVVLALGTFMEVLCHSCGTSTKEDMDHLKQGSHIIIGTPGRLLSIIRDGKLTADSIKMLVMDEADEMLSKGFWSQMIDLSRRLPSSTQVMFLSSTMPKLEVVSKLVRQPVHIVVKRDELPLADIKQFYVTTENEERKLDALCSLCEAIAAATHIVVFYDNREKVGWLKKKLIARHFTASAVHGNMPQGQREPIITAFSSGSLRILISTDSLLRGTDVPQLSLVINYDLPAVKENYSRRIGLLGRFGNKGAAINLVTNEDMLKLKEIEHFYSTQISEMSVKDPAESE
ncbi:MAG: eukaryotic initiation factor 4A-III [Benniella sp.]|nr:MAG: eukaryotic initiation factor 4A-III [Benniella sp.]